MVEPTILDTWSASYRWDVLDARARGINPRARHVSSQATKRRPGLSRQSPESQGSSYEYLCIVFPRWERAVLPVVVRYQN